MIEYKPITVQDFMSDPASAALARANAAELEPGVAGGPAPQMAIYQELERIGALIAWGAYSDGTLIGYSVAILSPAAHYSHTHAQMDVLYIAPEHRRGRTGLKLIERIRESIIAVGARHITWHAKPGSVFDFLCERRGLHLEEHVYLEVLSDGN